MAIDLMHWFANNDWPYPGGLKEQPSRIKSWADSLRIYRAGIERAQAGIQSEDRPNKPLLPRGR